MLFRSAALAVLHDSVRRVLAVARRLIGDHARDAPPAALALLGDRVGELALHQLWLAWGIEPSAWLAEPAGRAAAAVAQQLAAGTSDLEAALHQLIRAPESATALEKEEPTPRAAMGQEWILLQVGSGQVGSPAELAGLTCPAAAASLDTLLEAVVRLAQHGVPLAWRQVCGSEHCRVVSLPTYPFARERH